MGNVHTLGVLCLSTGIGMLMYGLIKEGLIVCLIGGVVLWARKKDSDEGG